jgi:sugar lactone lactonase YvrE
MAQAADPPAAADAPVVPEGAVVKKLADGFSFTEGPAAGPDGKIYFSDIPAERIHVFDPTTGKVAVHREQSGKANGLMFAPDGALYACEGGSRCLTRQVGNSITTVADRFENKSFNSPNDLVLDAKGGVYFTDPRYGSRDGMELPFEGVYYVPPQNGRIRCVLDSLKRPNGLILSPDGKILYVADNAAKTIWAYDVAPDGALVRGRQFAAMDPDGQGGGDGMTIDERGNVYCAGQGSIWIWNPAGQLVGKVTPPEAPANCDFGGVKNKTLYITARTGFYSVELNVGGIR